jgi:hypothetical protein
MTVVWSFTEPAFRKNLLPPFLFLIPWIWGHYAVSRIGQQQYSTVHFSRVVARFGQHALVFAVVICG